jgi:hypothetical protein
MRRGKCWWPTMKRKAKPQNIRERLMSELILCGGEVMSREEAVTTMQAEGVPRGALDWWFGVPALTDADIMRFSKNSLVLALRLQCYALGGEIDEE